MGEASTSSLVGDASGVSSTELPRACSVLSSKGWLWGGCGGVLMPTGGEGEQAGRASGGWIAVVVVWLWSSMVLMLMEGCCLTFQRLPGSPLMDSPLVGSLGRQ